jgi:hypothetical protein
MSFTTGIWSKFQTWYSEHITTSSSIDRLEYGCNRSLFSRCFNCTRYSTHVRTELSVHVRLHHADGSPVTESHAEHNEIFDAMKHALAINFGGSWPEHIHIKMADPDHRCSACGELLDPSGPDLAARIANLSV